MALMTPTLILFAVALATFAGAIAEHKAKQYLKTHNQRKNTAK